MTTNTNAALAADALLPVISWLEGGCDPLEAAKELRAIRDAALTTAAAVPADGWVMVPVEPTEEMIDAGSKKLGALYGHEGAKRCWHAQLAAAPKAEPVPAGEQEELREDASYESMNLAVMVLSDCGHSSNYKPLLERVAGRIDRHVERLLTAQRADLTMRAQAAPAAVAGPDRQALIDVIAQGLSDTWHCLRVWEAWNVGTMSQDDFEPVDESDTPAELADAILALLAAAPTTQAAPVTPSDAEIDAQWGESVAKHETTAAFVRDFALAVLARWGAPQPVARKPMEADVSAVNGINARIHFRRGWRAAEVAHGIGTEKGDNHGLPT